MVILQKWSLMQGEWSCYRDGHKWENGYATEVVTNGGRTEVVSLVEGEWLCYRGITLMQGKWSNYRGGQFIGRTMVMLQKWSL